MRKILIALALALLSANLASAQALRGTVTDAQTGEPLAGVNVVAVARSQGTTTGPGGRYALTGLPADTVTVAFTFVGYEQTVHTTDLSDGDAVLDVALVPAVEELGEVVVMEDAGREALTRATRSVAVLEPEELEALRGQTLGETLERLPGVTTLTTGPAIAKPVIRGLHSQRVVVLKEGVPQEGQQWGGEHAPAIDPFSPARVEVVRGAAAVEYGAGAIGGVVKVEGRELPRTPGLAGRLSVNAFSNNGQGAASALVEGGVPGLRGLGWRAQLSGRKAGATRAPGYVVGNTGFEELSGEVAVGYRRHRFGVEALASRFSTELGLYTGAHLNNLADLRRAAERGAPLVDYAFGYDLDAPKQQITHDLLSVRARYTLPAGDRIEAQYGLQQNHRQEFDAHRSADRAAFDLTLTTHTLEAKLTHRPVGHFVGAVGVSGMNQLNRNAESGFLIPNFRALTGGVFARETWLVNPRLTLEGGARYDVRWMRAYPYTDFEAGFERREHTYSALSGVLGGLYTLTPTWSLALNAGTAWRPPGVNELYSDGVHHGTAQYERGDPTLEPERSLDLSATLRHASSRVQAEVSLYRNRIADYVYLRPRTDASGELQPVVTIRGAYYAFDYVQADAALAGLDAAVEVRLTDRLLVGATAAAVRGTNLDADGPLFGMPADRLGLSAAYALPRFGPLSSHQIEAEATLVREQDRVPAGVEVLRGDAGENVLAPPPGYALLGLHYRTELALAGTEVFASLGVQNLLDVEYRDYLDRYRYYVDGPGRNVVFRLTIPFGRYDA